MPFLEFPLRLDGPYLRRVPEPQAILQLIEAMARTPARSWAGAPAFGVRDVFEGMRVRPEGIKDALRAINAALTDLGIDRYKLESIEKEPGRNADVDTYVFNLIDTSDPHLKYSRSLGK